MRRSDSNSTNVGGSTGLGDNADVLYTVPIELGGSVIVAQLDTGSSDLWVITDACHTGTCGGTNVTRYPSSQAKLTRTSVKIVYGDSATRTFASGKVGLDSASVARIAMADQPFGLIDSTTNPIILSQVAGILGVGFPGESEIQASRVHDEFKHSKNPDDDFILATYTDGPLIARMVLTKQLEEPMFSVTLQRSVIDMTGTGRLTIGKLPDGVDNSSLTWVPVRLYSTQDGGIHAPKFAPHEVYPLHWEIDIEGVFLNGSRIQDSGMNSGRVTALIDTGSSLIRGPQDVVNDIWKAVSVVGDPLGLTEVPVHCNDAHSLSFQIGGKLFPVDPRDSISAFGDSTTTCSSNLVSTDPPSKGSLFQWSLGDPFMRSNLVAFYYGNLTHPSVDPPRIGFLSTVPGNATQLLDQAIYNAQNNEGTFHEITELAPTASASNQPNVTLTATRPSHTASEKAPVNAASSFVQPLRVLDSCAFLVLLSMMLLWLF